MDAYGVGVLFLFSSVLVGRGGCRVWRVRSIGFDPQKRFVDGWDGWVRWMDGWMGLKWKKRRKEKKSGEGGVTRRLRCSGRDVQS